MSKQPNPYAMAAHRARTLTGFDHNRFMDAFRFSRVATAKGQDTWPLYKAALVSDDSATVAGIIEGAASTRTTPVSDEEARTTAHSPLRDHRVRLTPSQLNALTDMANGMTVAESAEFRGTSSDVTAYALKSARKRLHASNTMQAVAIALANHVILPSMIRRGFES